MLFERLKAPLRIGSHAGASKEEVFCVPHDGLNYVDVLSGPGDGRPAIMNGTELQSTYEAALRRENEPAMVVWMLNGALSGLCESLMHLERTSDGRALLLRRLFVRDQQLQRPTSPFLHESLLLALVALCDVRGMDIRIQGGAILQPFVLLPARPMIPARGPNALGARFPVGGPRGAHPPPDPGNAVLSAVAAAREPTGAQYTEQAGGTVSLGT
jgi:hypothetical protein